MGNRISCRLGSTKSARVILPGGEIRQFKEPVMAADLMLESPNFFLVNSRSLMIGRRLSPITADEELEFGNLYIMIPMRRVHSVATAADIAVFMMAGNSASRRIQDGDGVSGGARISPETGVGGGENGRGATELSSDGEVTEFKYRLTVCRSKRPALDTIAE